jgi:hypothetical protein
MKQQQNSRLISLCLVRKAKKAASKDPEATPNERARVVRFRRVAHQPRRQFSDLPLIGPNRLPPEYLAA